VYVSTWDSLEYKVELTIRAKGLTIGDAEVTIDGLDIDVVEEMVQNQLTLTLVYNIPELTWNKLAIQVRVFLPADSIVNLDLVSSNGGIHLTDIEGSTVQLSTSNGELNLERVYAESISGDSSNGRVIGEIEASDVTLSTSNGRIDLNLPCTTTGVYDLSTSNGRVILSVSSSNNIGYDLDLSTSNGDIVVDLPDLTYSVDGENSKEAKTADFAGKAIQITINLSTSNGDVDVGT
jgi:DUF4097 and DUF4098 domain-containing protein YvlB